MRGHNHFRNWYRNEYLWSPHWRQRRSEYLLDAAHTCEHCGNFACDVHHTNYTNLFEERDEDLQAVCRNCHDQLHNLAFCPLRQLKLKL